MVEKKCLKVKEFLHLIGIIVKNVLHVCDGVKEVVGVGGVPSKSISSS